MTCYIKICMWNETRHGIMYMNSALKFKANDKTLIFFRFNTIRILKTSNMEIKLLSTDIRDVKFQQMGEGYILHSRQYAKMG